MSRDAVFLGDPKTAPNRLLNRCWDMMYLLEIGRDWPGYDESRLQRTCRVAPQRAREWALITSRQHQGQHQFDKKLKTESHSLVFAADSGSGGPISDAVIALLSELRWQCGAGELRQIESSNNMQHQLTPGEQVLIQDLPTSGKLYHENRNKAEKEFKALRDELIEKQATLYAEDKHRLLIVFQAMDAGGKDSTIRKVFRGVNPQGVRVASFKAPSKEELAHDYLWRIHQRVPKRGMISVFNRSHYEDVLVVRVNNLVPESVWQQRYEQINEFERLLFATGTTILKFFLHISPAEQKERFQDRLDTPSKHWKFSLDDLEKRRQWDHYMLAYQEALNRCTTEHAPWHVIPADQKWYRNLAITRIIVQSIRDLDPQYPVQDDDLSKVVIE